MSCCFYDEQTYENLKESDSQKQIQNTTSQKQNICDNLCLIPCHKNTGILLIILCCNALWEGNTCDTRYVILYPYLSEHNNLHNYITQLRIEIGTEINLRPKELLCPINIVRLIKFKFYAALP